MALQLEGANSPNTKVSTNTDGELLVALSPEQTAGFAAATAEVDDGTIVTRDMKSIEVSQDYRLRSGVDSMVFSEPFPGSAINSGVWTAPVTTMTVTVTGGNVNLNAGLSTASGAVARVASYQQFQVYGSFGTTFALALQRTQAPVTNNVSEWGAIICTGTSAPTDGAFFRLGSDGSFKCVINNNGTESTSADLASNLASGPTWWPVDTTANFQVEFGEDFVFFWVMPQGSGKYPIKIAELPRPVGFGHTMSRSLPLCIRTYNSSATGAAQSIKCSHAHVFQRDAENSFPFQIANSISGKHIYQGQTGGTMGSLANFANSANPTAAVPTNTTAALASGLGGQFWETDTLAVTTDGIVQSYQNPAGTASLPGKTIVITGVKIESFIQTALTGGGYNAVWSLAFGHNNVSLATTESASARSPRRIALGNQAVASGATALTALNSVSWTFPEGIPVYPNEFIQTVKKKVGTAPSAGVIAHTITFTGYQI